MDDGPIVAKLAERGYPVEVAAPLSQSSTWPRDVPVIKEFSIINPPVGAPPSYVPGETLYIKVGFTEPVSFVQWEPPATVGVNTLEAASLQTLENLRLRFAGLKGYAGTSRERAVCESARFDVSSNGTGQEPSRVWSFEYKIPPDVYTEDGSHFGVADDNGIQSFALGVALGTTPFWFYHERDTSLNSYIQVGGSFAGPNRKIDTSTGRLANGFYILDAAEYAIPDLTMDEGNRAFVPNNTIKKADIQSLIDARRYSRDILSFTGLIKGTPAGATYERGYVALGWTVMMNLVFAIFVTFIAWAAITSIVRPLVSGQASGYGWKDMAPRVTLSAIAVGSSYWWCRLMIDLADAISRYVAEALQVNPGDIIHIGLTIRQLYDSSPFRVGIFPVGDVLASIMGIFLLLALLFYLVMGLLILGQLILRIVLLNLLMILAPIGLSMFILPDTVGLGKKWLQLWMVTLFRHALQLVGLGLALSFVRSVIPIGSEIIGYMDVFWALVLSTFALYLTYKLPTMMGDGGISEGYLSTMTMVTNVIAHLPQSMRTGGMMIAGAGTGGVASTAMMAGQAAPRLGSTAFSNLSSRILSSPVSDRSGGGIRSQG